jgi:DNA gyrase/topoisomerase IV subunit B
LNKSFSKKSVDDRLRHEASALSPDDICAEILALSVVEYTYTPSLSISVELGQSGGQIHDSGRGIMLTPDPGDTMSHAERSHTCIYPCVSANPKVDSILQELVWGKRGALGPALPTAACPMYQFVSERDGEKWSQTFQYGVPLGPPKMLGQTSASGTTITFDTGGRINHAAFARLTDSLRFRIPGLVIAFRARP